MPKRNIYHCMGQDVACKDPGSTQGNKHHRSQCFLCPRRPCSFPLVRTLHMRSALFVFSPMAQGISCCPRAPQPLPSGGSKGTTPPCHLQAPWCLRHVSICFQIHSHLFQLQKSIPTTGTEANLKENLTVPRVRQSRPREV